MSTKYRISWSSSLLTSSLPHTNAEVQASYDLTSDHTPSIVTISTNIVVRKPALRLHTSHTNWALYNTVVPDKVTTVMKLKTCEDTEIATTNFIRMLWQAAPAATPTRHPHSPASNKPSEIKRLVAVKHRARSKWETTQAPDDRRLNNNARNKIKVTLHKLRNASFTAYISSLKRDKSIWKTLKSRKKPEHSPRFVKIQHPRDLGPRATPKNSIFSLTT